jgi:hypothetical protein
MDILESLLPYQLDLYVQSDKQDPETGSINKEWQYYKTIDCSAKGVVSNSTSTRANDRQQISNRYTLEQFIQLRTAEKINVRHKITNIRNKDGEYIWTELDYPTETPTVFEVVGMTPINDPFGVNMGYNVTAKRSENQGLGI